MQGQFWKIFCGRRRGCGTAADAAVGTGREAPRCPFRPRGAPRGRRRCRRPPLRRPRDISNPADRRFSHPRRGPPSVQRPSRRRRARCRGQPRPRAPDDSKTMPVYGANRAPAHPTIPKPCRFTGPGREPPSMAQSVKSKPQVDDSHIPRNAGCGRPVRVQPRNPT